MFALLNFARPKIFITVSHCKLMFHNRFVGPFIPIYFFLLVGMFYGCGESFHRNKSHAAVPLSSIKQGNALAGVYCGSCHALPDPSQLNAESWEKGVLPNMGPRLGVFEHNFMPYRSARNDRSLPSGFYPDSPLLTSEQWQHILNYYTATSPDTLPEQQRKQPIRMNGSLFEVQAPALQYTGAMTSLVKITEGDAAQSLCISDAGTQKLYFLNKALQPTDSVRTSGPVVDMQLFQNTILTCNIGILNPNNGAHGKAGYIRKNEAGTWSQDSAGLFQMLQRPVQVSPADLNGDGLTDYLICEFGFLTGSLCWMENKGNEDYRRHMLRAAPGAVKAYVQDYNHDGNMDIWVLFAQGEEGIFIYTNKGNGRFEEREVVRFPPVYGSSYFELADFNADGYPDIVYTCGDNADYSPVLKPYHGVYIFLNDTKNGFQQQFFFPMHGCYKAMAPQVYTISG